MRQPLRRAIARQEEPHPRAQLTFTNVDGRRFQVLITDLPDTDVAYLEALQRGRGRAEKLICDAKDTGLANPPSADFAINAAWMTTALMAHDLLARTRALCLDGDLAQAEPKRLRYRLFPSAGGHRPLRPATSSAHCRRLALGRRARCRLRARPVRAVAHLSNLEAPAPLARRDNQRPDRERWSNACRVRRQCQAKATRSQQSPPAGPVY